MQPRPFLTILIPAYNEAGIIETTVKKIVETFSQEGIEDYEILVVNDNSKDETETILKRLSEQTPSLRYVNNSPPNGIGYAIRKGLDHYKGDAVAIVMADLSDSPVDIVTYSRALKNGAECVFGSRFIKGSKVLDYPKHKYLPNRLVNYFIKNSFVSSTTTSPTPSRPTAGKSLMEFVLL